MGFACTPAPASCCRDFGRRPLLTSAVPHSWWRGAPSLDLPGTKGIAFFLHLCPCVCWCAQVHTYTVPSPDLGWNGLIAHPSHWSLHICCWQRAHVYPHECGLSLLDLARPEPTLQVLLVMLTCCWPWCHRVHPPTFAHPPTFGREAAPACPARRVHACVSTAPAPSEGALYIVIRLGQPVA